MKLNLLFVGFAIGMLTTIRAVSQTGDDDPTDAVVATDDADDLDSTDAAVTDDETNADLSADTDGTESDDKTGRREDLSSIDSEADGLSYDIRKLRRQAEDLNADDFARRVKRLETDADDLSLQATEAGADDAAMEFDETSSALRRVRREIQLDPKEFYKERDWEIGRKLKRGEASVEDAQSSVQDAQSSLDDDE